MLQLQLSEKEEKANLLATRLAKIITETHKKSGKEAIPLVKLYIRILLENYYRKNKPPATLIYQKYNKYRADGKLDFYLQSSVADRVQPLTDLFAEVLSSSNDVSALQEVVYLNLLVMSELECQIQPFEEFMAQLISYYEAQKMISGAVNPIFEELYIIFLNDYIYNPTAVRIQDWLQSKYSVALNTAEPKFSLKDERTIAEMFFTNDDCICFLFKVTDFIQYFKPLTNFSIAQLIVRASANDNLLQLLCQPFVLPILNAPARTRSETRLALSSYLSQAIYDISVKNMGIEFWEHLDLSYYFELHPDTKKRLIQNKPEMITVIVNRLLKDPSVEVVEELSIIEKVQPTIIAELVNEIAVAFGLRLKQLPQINPKMASEALTNLFNKINKLQHGKTILERMDPNLTNSLNRTEKRNIQKKFPSLGQKHGVLARTIIKEINEALGVDLGIPESIIRRSMKQAQKKAASQTHEEKKTTAKEPLKPNRPRSKSLPEENKVVKTSGRPNIQNTIQSSSDNDKPTIKDNLSDSEKIVALKGVLNDSETDKTLEQIIPSKLNDTEADGQHNLKTSADETTDVKQPSETTQNTPESTPTQSEQTPNNEKAPTKPPAANAIVPDNQYREHLSAIVGGEKTLSIELTDEYHFIIDFSTLPDLWFVTPNIGQNPQQASMSPEAKHTIITSIIRSLKTYKDISNEECRIETIPEFPLQLKIIPKRSHLMYPEKSHKFCFELLKKHATVTKILTPNSNTNKFESKTNAKPNDRKDDTKNEEQKETSLLPQSPESMAVRLRKVLHEISSDRFPDQQYHLLIKPTYNAKKKVFVLTVDKGARQIADRHTERVDVDKVLNSLSDAIKSIHGDAAVRLDKNKQKATVVIFYLGKTNIEQLEKSTAECRKKYLDTYEKTQAHNTENEDLIGIITAIERAIEETVDTEEIKQLRGLLDLFKPQPIEAAPSMNRLSRIIRPANSVSSQTTEMTTRLSKLTIHNAVCLAKVHLERREFDKVYQLYQYRKEDKHAFMLALINTSFRQGRLDQVLVEFYQTYLPELDESTFDSMFRSAINVQSFDICAQLIRTYPAYLNQKLCILWLDVLLTEKKFLEVINFAREMIDTPYSVHVSAILIRAYTQMQDFEQATKIFQATPEKDHAPFHKAWLHKLQAENKADESINYLNEISSLPIYLDDCTAIVLATLVRHKDYVRANKLYQTWQKSNSHYLQETQFFSLYKQGFFEEAVDLYCRFRLTSLRAQSTLLDIYKETEQYELATTLYHSIKAPNVFVQQTWLQILVRTKQSTEAIQYYQENLRHVIDSTLPHNTMLNCLLTDPTQLPLILDIIEQLEKVCQSHSNQARRYFSAACDVAYYYDQLQATYRKQQFKVSDTAWKLITEKIQTFANIMRSVIQLNPWISPTVREACLLTKYFPDENFTPVYERLSEEKMNEITEAAFQASDHPLTSLATEANIVIDEVNFKGQKTGEYRLNHSIYREICHAALPNYIIVKFQGPMSSDRLPLYITYRGEIYRTDVFGGSKLRQRLNINQFAAMIAVPLVASDYFSRFLNHRESFGRAQRAFLPEEADTHNLGLKGTFRIMTIPDHTKIPFFSHFMTQDGGGYIKRSVANQIGLQEGLDYQPSPAFLSYQALQCYAVTEENAAVVTELTELATPYLGQVTPDAKITSELPRNLYYALSGGLPSYMGTAVPVVGSKLVLPNTELWRSHAKSGVIIGRNPYDSKQLQYIAAEDILYCDYLAGAISVQYTLTGYEMIPAIWGDIYVGHSFKGMLTLVDDKHWPLSYQECDLVVSSKDRKLCTSWENADDKTNAQNPANDKTFMISGSLVVKFATKPGQLIGIPDVAPNQILTRTAADCDGDEFNVISVEQFPQFAAMVQREMPQQIINPKIPKTFTPLKNGRIGFFDKVLALWQPILERWTAIRNVICILSPEQFNQFCQRIVTDHKLAQFVGANWHDQLTGISEEKHQEHIVMLEIQSGIKFGEDALKTEIPTELILNRVNEYESLLREFVPILQVPYGKSLMRKLSKANSYEEIVATLKPISLDVETYNIVHATMVATVKKFVG